MFNRNKTPTPRSAYSREPYPPPRAPWVYESSHGPKAANSFNFPNVEMLPRYEWKPQPFTSAYVPPHIASITSGRKRRHNEHSTYALKRQRVEPLLQLSPASPLRLVANPPPAAEETLRSGIVGFDHFNPNPLHHPNTEVLTVPDISLSIQNYITDKLSGQMVELFEACQQQSSDLERKEACRARLQEVIQEIFPVARLYLTGSSMNGLGSRSSDADLCLVIKGNKRPNPIDVLSRLKRAFRSLPYIERIQLIRAKVPILKFRERGSHLEFDLNVNNTVGIRNTFLLRSYAYADVRVRPMILVIKKWARHNQINDASKGTLSSYTLALMVLHYLQTLKEPVLPSLQKAHPESFNPFMDIDMVPDGPKNIPPYISRNQSSLGELLLGFLRYYATVFSWDKQVISVREATTLPKTNSQEWRNKFICVEEPFERNNVARAVHEKMKFDAIKVQFAESYWILHARKDLNSILPLRSIISKESARR
ncbi:PREDICTED: poly(A) RNA polymerase GLD2 [Cyprinodon variegatus]|uniref:polynucleotide adenylyltransferase n=1 Tax=Cyprinodon variegatus TaxID=28743 RepID=A0A3Q2E485_CYPVA|nr:PREDICTED: poly(A) RNA polymerase GLD2 [Cyprinodon variegatus]XP_015252249.1 PREDICTED: poly(A) RNA polymerase GLD2 [Cyprinodon variegatus]